MGCGLEGGVILSLGKLMQARRSISWTRFETVGSGFREVSAEGARIEHGRLPGGLQRPDARDGRHSGFHVEQLPRHAVRQVLEEQKAAKCIRQVSWHIWCRITSLWLFEG